MRLLVLSNLYPPHTVGGYERDCASAVARWRAAGHEVTVLTTRATRRGGQETGVRRDLPGDPLRRGGPRGGTPARVLWHAASSVAARRALAAARPDLVVTFGAGCISRAAVATLLGAAVPSLAVVYDRGLLEQLVVPEASPPRVPVDRVLRAALRPAFHRTAAGRPAPPPDRWVFCSHALRRAYETELGPLTGATVVHHGVDVPQRRPPLRRDRTALRAGALGRLVADKGFHTLLEAARLLAEEDPASAPAVEVRGPAVDAAYRAHLERLAERARAAGAAVSIGDPLPPSSVRGWMLEQDVIVAPAEWEEPFALVPLEAMAAGRPVVGTRNGGAAELLEDGRNALVVPPADPPGLALALRRLATDPGLGDRLADAAFERVRRRHRRAAMEVRIDAALEAAVEAAA